MGALSDFVAATPLSEERVAKLRPLIEQFVAQFEPIERERLHLLTDSCTKAVYVECHVFGSKLIASATTDVPLDPEEQLEYRANREILLDHSAFKAMKKDAAAGRTFSNIVCEFVLDYNSERPLKVIGGQHRFEAIKLAVREHVDELHGIKVYFDLDTEQRLDVQLISNTNIAVSPDLYDRMQETVFGPELRQWCQEVGLLQHGQDFADKRQRGDPVTVRAARTFILNYYSGVNIAARDFDRTETTPSICSSGTEAVEWEELKRNKPRLWTDPRLQRAGGEFARLVQVQRAAFSLGKGKEGPNSDSAHKALNYAVLSAWAYVAGVLHSNSKRLERHFGLANKGPRDPLNAAALAKGRHKTDQDNYRGLGYRTDAKERGRLVELFYLQAEGGEGITKGLIDLAIKKYHAKQANLEVLKSQNVDRYDEDA